MNIFETLHNDIIFFIFNKMTYFTERLENPSSYKNYHDWYTTSIKKLELFDQIIHKHKQVISENEINILIHADYLYDNIMSLLYDVYPILFAFDCSDDIYNLLEIIVYPFVKTYLDKK